jgi:hypothetical protein
MASSSTLAGPSQIDVPDAQSLGVAENALRRCAEHAMTARDLKIEHEIVEAALAAIRRLHKHVSAGIDKTSCCCCLQPLLLA